MSKWIDFVRKWASENNVKFGCAMSMPECKAEYRKMHPKPEKRSAREKRSDKFLKEKAEEIKSMTPTQRIKRTVKARKERSMSPEPKARKSYFFRAEEPKPIAVASPSPAMEMSPIRSRPMPVRRPKGKGLAVMSSAESSNGLSHIYPLSHGQIIRMTRGI